MKGQEIYGLNVYSEGRRSSTRTDRPSGNRLVAKWKSRCERSQKKVVKVAKEERARQVERLAHLREEYKSELDEATTKLDAISRDAAESPQQAQRIGRDSIAIAAFSSNDRRSGAAQAIEKRIDELREAGKIAADADPIIDELQKILTVRQEQVAHTFRPYSIRGRQRPDTFKTLKPPWPKLAFSC